MAGVGMNFWTSGFGVSLMEMKSDRMNEARFRKEGIRLKGLQSQRNAMDTHFTLRAIVLKDENIVCCFFSSCQQIAPFSGIL